MKKRILVVGDSATDVFINVDTHRLSPEAPVPAVIPHSVRANPGMAANVAANIALLAPDFEVTTIFPRESSVKTRYVDRKTNHHFLRVDQDSTTEPMSVNEFSNVFDADYNNPYDALVFSDYNKGFLTETNMETIAGVCFVRGTPLFLDTKKLLGAWSKRVAFVKINEAEASAHFKAGITPYDKCGNLITTRGGNGMCLYRPDGVIDYESPGIKVDVADLAGAGDTVLAALVVNYLETRDIKVAMDYANKAAAVAVSKRGVVAVSREEMI